MTVRQTLKARQSTLRPQRHRRKQFQEQHPHPGNAADQPVTYNRTWRTLPETPGAVTWIAKQDLSWWTWWRIRDCQSAKIRLGQTWRDFVKSLLRGNILWIPPRYAAAIKMSGNTDTRTTRDKPAKSEPKTTTSGYHTAQLMRKGQMNELVKNVWNGRKNRSDKGRTLLSEQYSK